MPPSWSSSISLWMCWRASRLKRSASVIHGGLTCRHGSVVKRGDKQSNKHLQCQHVIISLYSNFTKRHHYLFPQERNINNEISLISLLFLQNSYESKFCIRNLYNVPNGFRYAKSDLKMNSVNNLFHDKMIWTTPL